jgi:hypothetical protein
MVGPRAYREGNGSSGRGRGRSANVEPRAAGGIGSNGRGRGRSANVEPRAARGDRLERSAPGGPHSKGALKRIPWEASEM